MLFGIDLTSVLILTTIMVIAFIAGGLSVWLAMRKQLKQ